MPDSSGRRFDALAEELHLPQTRVLSVDCFDTLLMRKVPKPADVHLLVGRRLKESGQLLEHISEQGFAKLRRLAEEEARRRKVSAADSPEVALAEIYSVLVPGVWQGAPDQEPYVTEVATEIEILFADLDLASFIANVIEDLPISLIVVSDTYFSEKHLRTFIDQTSLKSLRFDRVFTSSDCGVGKGSGLWPSVIEAMGVAPDEVVHVGDNFEADVVWPERIGIRAVHCPISTDRFNAIDIREGIAGREDYPSKWCDSLRGDGGITALRRRATLTDPGSDFGPHEQVAWETGASVFGPVFTGFAQWVLEQSELVGAGRLLFLMREGQLLKEFADHAVVSGPWRPALRTAWVSREACARASIFDGTESELLSFLERLRPPPPSQLVISFGLDHEDIPELGELELNFELSSEREQQSISFVELVLSRSDLIDKIIERSALKRDRLMRYIREVAGDGNGPVGLVDVGWSGSIQESLHVMFQRDADPIDFHGLYLLAHVGSSSRALRGVRLQGYLGTLGTDPFDVAAITGGAEIVELVSTSAEGSLLEIGADLQPVLAPASGNSLEQRSRSLVQLGARSYQDSWVAHHQNGSRAFETTEIGIALLSRILKRFVSQPNHDEAVAFNWWLHEENYGSHGTEQLVPPRYLATIRHRSAENLHWAPMSDLHWTGGAAALVDNELSDAIFLMREGTVDPGRFSSSPGGVCRLEVHGFHASPLEHEVRLIRNRHGLSHVEWRVPVSGATRLVVYPADHFVLFRPDMIEVIDCASDLEPVTQFHWARGDERSILPTSSMRWMTTQVVALDPSSAFVIELPEPVTSRELRVTIAGAYLPTADTPDDHLSRDPEREIAALQQEISNLYRTKIFRLSAFPRGVYSSLRKTRQKR